jgi:subtilase family serine protease
VTTPGSSSYRHFLTSTQYAQRFSPSNTQLAQVRAWLQSTGLHVTGVAPGNRYVTVTGTIAQADAAFGTTLRTYRHGGQLVTAPATDATVPANVASAVVGVTGLDNAPHYARTKVAGNPPAPDASLRARPCSQWYGQLTATTQNDGTPLPKFQGSYRPWTTCGYQPQQFNSAYGNPSLSGAGTAVGITLWYNSTTQPADENRFDSAHGWPGLAPGQYRAVEPSRYTNGNLCGTAQDEQAIDITAIHNIAPAAKIVYYAAASCFDNDLIDDFGRVVDANTVSVINSSWGGLLSDTTSGLIAAYEQVFIQGALQGQEFLFSSGDDGDWAAVLGQSDQDFPASDPWVTAVGGTTLNLNSLNQNVWEAGWGEHAFDLSNGRWVDTGFAGGAGGGFAPAWARPGYQNGVVNSPDDGRAYPDIAADGDPVTGELVGYTQHFPGGNQYAETRWGGTSVSSPLVSGVQALAEQKLGGRIGFANPLIYKLARSHSAALNDVTSAHNNEALVRVDFNNLRDTKQGVAYTLRTVGQDSSLTTGPGWDDVTGNGTPNAKYPAALARAAG